MACKGARKKRAVVTTAVENSVVKETQQETKKDIEEKVLEKLYFGVDSKVQSDDILQNNINHFEWVVRNKVYPSFWGRNIVGENALTEDEISFIHSKGCKIAAIYTDSGDKQTYEQGQVLADDIGERAIDLCIPKGTSIFLEIGENEVVTTSFMRGFVSTMIEIGHIPGFKANTDAAFDFDREFSRGLQTDREIFEKSLIWAVAPSLEEYYRVTTTHLLYPDVWKPFAPSGITRQDIAIWQYGKECHPIHDDAGKETVFNVNLIRDANIILEKMF